MGSKKGPSEYDIITSTYNNSIFPEFEANKRNSLINASQNREKEKEKANYKHQEEQDRNTDFLGTKQDIIGTQQGVLGTNKASIGTDKSLQQSSINTKTTNNFIDENQQNFNKIKEINLKGRIDLVNNANASLGANVYNYTDEEREYLEKKKK